MKALFLCCIVSVGVYANDIPKSWLDSQYKSNAFIEEDFDQTNLNQKLQSITETHNNVLERLAIKYPNLDRFDLALGVNSSGGIGIYSIGKSKSIEMIWRRRSPEKPKAKKEDIIINIDPLKEDSAIAQEMVEQLGEIVDFSQIRGRIKRKIIRTLYRDASRINKFAKMVINTPQVGHWYTSAFWKNYYFSSSFGLLDVLNIGYAKRVRFRFKITRAPYRIESEQSTSLLTRMMGMFNRVNKLENQEDQFDLHRVWASVDFNLDFDILIFSKSIGKGYLVEFRKKEDYIDHPHANIRFGKLPARLVSAVSNTFNQQISKRIENDQDNIMAIDRVRYIFGISNSFDLSLVSLEKDSNINFHFKRRKRSTEMVEILSADNNSNTKELNEHTRVNLSQIDYRHRASFSFGIPFINRVRIRPSFESRYFPK